MTFTALPSFGVTKMTISKKYFNMKTKFPKLILLLISLFSQQIFCSCITVSRIVSMYIENPENYEEQIIESEYFSHGFFSFLSAPKPDRAFNWNEYSLEMYAAEKKESGWEFKKKESVSTKGIFKKNGETLFYTEISSNSVKKKTLRQALWPFGEATTLDTEIKIITGKEKNQIFLAKNSNWRTTQTPEEENLVLEDNFVVPIKIFRVNNSLTSNGQKLYYSIDTPGFRFQIFDENYAVLDLMASKAKFKMNKAFSKPLAEYEKDYISSLILLFWKYYIEFECNEIFAKSTKIICGLEGPR